MSRGFLIALIALAVSVALNVFGAATLMTTLIGRDRAEDRVEAQQRPGRTGSPMGLVSRLSPEVQPRVRQALRDAALAARPDFEEARLKRRQAVALAASPTFDPDRLRTLLDQSRAAELRGRQRLEVGAIAVLADLGPADRAIMAEILSRKRGGGSGRGHDQARPDNAEADPARQR
jgi:uncharacterized membrane protein